MSSTSNRTSDLIAVYVTLLFTTLAVAGIMPNLRFNASRQVVDRLEGPNLIVLSYVVLYFLVPYLLHRESGQPQPSESSWKRRFRSIRIAAYRLAIAWLVLSPIFYTLASSHVMFDAYPVAAKVDGAAPSTQYPSGGAVVLATISDTHITDRVQTLEGQKDGPQKLRRMLEVVSSTIPKLVVILGDSTDRGEEAEWRLFMRILFEPMRGGIGFAAAQPLILLPGNHDIHGSPFQLQGSEASAQQGGVFGAEFTDEPSVRRTNSYFAAAKLLKMPTRAPGDEGLTANGVPELFARLLEDASKQKIGVPVADAQTGRAVVFVDYPEGFTERKKQAIDKARGIFPILYVDISSGLALILMNSSAKPRAATSMGLGDLDRDQLDRFKELLAKLAGNSAMRILVVALHHAPVKRSTDSWSWLDAFKRRKDSDLYEHTFLALDPGDAEDFLHELGEFSAARKNVPIVIAHGHRHGNSFVGRTAQGIWVMEAPATIENWTPAEFLAIKALSENTFALELIGGKGQVLKQWKLN